MKTLFTSLFLLIFAVSFSQQKEIAVASCCNNAERGCTGSSSCTACSNCSGCKHCAKNGGSCGVCSGGSYKSYSTSKPKKKKTSSAKTSSSSTKTNSYNQTNSISTYNGGDYLYVNINELNVRKESNSKSSILEKVKLNDALKYIKTEGSWYKVEVVATKTVGYVYYKYVK